jgi:hypothetical protein
MWWRETSLQIFASPFDPPDELINMLKKQFRQDDASVFDTTNFRKEFQQASVAAGLGKITKKVSAKGYKWEKYEGVTPHDFRRSGIRKYGSGRRA